MVESAGHGCERKSRVAAPESSPAQAPVDVERRAVLSAGALIGLCGLLGLDDGTAAAAAPGEPFEATTLEEALSALGGRPASSDLISVRVPPVVEDGAVVPVTVSSRLAKVDAIYLLAEQNPLPLAVAATIPVGTEAFVSTRLKLGGSGRVYAVVRADGALYTHHVETRVTLGGCH